MDNETEDFSHILTRSAEMALLHRRSG